ncbi:unnamed protein product [Phytomonas sp. EM1]|nr:unnamed protein product [Phytomonas sp. EM1]|eukprot:CCW61293.1 unnamed protein product [Phytomonas sp. isolate EM1]
MDSEVLSNTQNARIHAFTMNNIEGQNASEIMGIRHNVDPTGCIVNNVQNLEETTTPISLNVIDEDICAVCLEKPEEGCFVRLWCCNNVLCVHDAQQISRCPLCRMVPLAWDIVK